MNYRMRRVVRASIHDSIRRPQKQSWLPPFIAARRKPGVHERSIRRLFDDVSYSYGSMAVSWEFP